MLSIHPKKENSSILFFKFFVLPIVSIVSIVFVLQQYKAYSEMKEVVKENEVMVKPKVSSMTILLESSPKISSISKGMDKK